MVVAVVAAAATAIGTLMMGQQPGPSDGSEKEVSTPPPPPANAGTGAGDGTVKGEQSQDPAGVAGDLAPDRCGAAPSQAR